MNYLDIKSSLANLSKQSLVCVFSVALGLMILLLFSGGFNSTICFLIGIAILVVAFIVFVKDHFKNISVASLTLIFLSVIFFISSIINSLVCTSIISSILPVSLLGFSMILSMSNNDEKNLLTRLISIIGLASSIFGICLFFLPIEVLGGVYEGRLMFPFQYANSSGIWYLISAILCWQTSNTKFRFASIFPLIALFLTKSGGAICIFIVVAIIYIIKWFKYEKHERKFNVAAITVIMIVAVFSIIFTVINKERVFQASQTFFERIVQINDGWSLLITSPLLGVGPDQWQFIYPYIQSAQYTASKIHCSYLQIALDGGFIGLFIFLGFVVFSVINLIKNKNWQMLICASVILVHSIIDFDLSFPFMMVLLIYFLDSKKLNFTFVANIVLSFACLIFCVFGIYFNTQLNSFVNLPQKYKQSKSFTIEFCS